MVKVSIILCAYNEEKYIKDAIESALKQTLKDIELIIVNDGSTDKTENIIKNYHDTRIKLINQKNKGLGASRNTGLNNVSGEYIMFLDADDYLVENAAEIAYKEASAKNTDLSFFKIINYSTEYYESDWFSLKSFNQAFNDRVFNAKDTKDFQFDMSVSACQKIYKTEFLEKINAKFPENINFEDMPFFYYVYLKAKRITLIQDFLYIRRKHEGSITNKVDSKFLDTVKAGQILMDIFIKNNWYEEYKYDLLAYKINGPRYALMSIDEEYKQELYGLIKKDYIQIKETKYYNDYLTNLGPVKKKFFTDIIKSENYEDFIKLQEN